MPVLREKKRYLAFEIISNDKINFNLASNAIKEAFIRYAGLDGYANAGILILKDLYNPEMNSGVIKVSNKEIDRLKTSLLFIKKIGNKNVIFKTKSCSGIIKKIKNKR
ncbi:MAG: Rpp14/Pop5 family protein [Candidatus Woesearchaeota archaeon]